MLSLLLIALASNYMNTTELPSWSSIRESISTFNASSYTFPIPTLSFTQTLPLPPISLQTPDMTPYAVFYFLSGAAFFLGTAWLLLSNAQSDRDRALEGIATMSDFTKTKMRYSLDYVPSKEVINLIQENGMEFEEFLNRLAGTRKRARRPVSEST